VIGLTADERRRLADLRREQRTLLKPHKDAARKERRTAGKAREKMAGERAAGQRQPREQDRGFLAYLRRQPCEAAHLGGCDGPIEAAHIRYSDAAKGVANPGAGRKNHDRHANPLCRRHHQHDQHTRSERAFWAALGKDAYDTAAAHFAAYRGGQP
jgi:hypothetical protein